MLSRCFSVSLYSSALVDLAVLRIDIGVIAKERAVRAAIRIAIIAIDALAIRRDGMQQLLARCYRQRKCDRYRNWFVHVLICMPSRRSFFIIANKYGCHSKV